MTSAEAVRLLALVQAEWPSRPLPDDTVKAWAFDLLPLDFAAASEAVHTLAGLNRFPPSLAEILEAANDEAEHRRQLEAASRHALPGPDPDHISLEEFLHGRPDMAERVKKLGLWKDTLKTLETA